MFFAAAGIEAAPAGCFWSAPHELSGEALPTVMKKVIEAAIPGSMTNARTRESA